MRKIALKNYVLCCLLGWLPALVNAQSEAAVKEYEKTYTTYPFSQPNPVANPTNVYPYFRFDGFTDKPEEQKWKIVELENDFIKVQVMPQIGGKIWTAVDKKNNRSFIYNNDVVKFRDIAMRGAWTSGGIEANFGIIGHTPGVATPINYLTRKNDDGSVSCIVSLLDMLTQTRWSMEIKLQKDKAFFTTAVFWHNGTAEDEPYYSWMNMAELAGEDVQFIEPGTNHLFHDGKSYSWPIDAEHKRDLSYYSQVDFGGAQSFHITGVYSKYWGSFHKNENYGMIHYAEREDKLGKKIFVWGKSRDGMIWDKLLNDNVGQYAELQSGRLYIQNAPQSVYSPYKQTSFTPYQTDTWKEYWYPYSNTGGVAIADTTGVLNVKQEGKSVKVFFSAVSYINDTLKITGKDGKLIFSRPVKLQPLQTFEQSVELKNSEAIARVSFGETKFNTKDTIDKVLSRPTVPLVKVDYTSAYGLYLKGQYLTGTRHYAEAEACIKASLAKDPGLLPALSEMALLQYKKMDYQAAFEYARKAISVNTYDGQANYYFGLAALKLDKVYDAEDGLQVAALTGAYRAAAYTELCRIKMMQQHYDEANSYAIKSLQSNTQNITALQLQYLGARLMGETKLEKEVKARILALDPLNHFIRFEDYLKNRDKETAAKFTSLIRDEMPEQTYLDLAVWYHELNRNEESKTILEMAPQKNNELLYWLAYLHRYDKNAGRWLNDATNGNANMVFPYKANSVAVMQWAAQQNKQDWKPRYYLSLLYESARDRLKARKEIENIDSAINFAPFYAFRARVRDSARHDQQLGDLIKAASIDREDWRYVKYLTEFLIAQKQYKQALNTVAPYSVQHPDNYIIGMLYVRSLMLNNDYSTAERVLETLHVLPYEGAKDGHKLYEQTKLVLALQLLKANKLDDAEQKVKEARLWPEQLGVGAPYANMVDNKLENNIDETIRQARKGKAASATQINGFIARAKAINGM